MTRRRIAIALGVVAITAGGATVARIVFDRLVYEPEPPPRIEAQEPPAPTPPPAPARFVRVLAVRGTVERSSRAGRWGPVTVGDQLGAEDSVRTGASSSAELGVGERSRMTVAARTQLKVHEVTSAVDQFRIARGLIAVDYGEGRERQVRIEDESGRSVEAEEARFGVLATGTMLAVATESGSVTLRARGEALAVAAGEQSAARGDRPPSTAEPIPGALLLKLAAAAADLDRDECAAISGVVSAASSVDVDGRPVAPGEDGRFVVRVRRRRGQATVLVTVADALGRTAERGIPCRAAEPYVKDLRVRWTR